MSTTNSHNNNFNNDYSTEVGVTVGGSTFNDGDVNVNPEINFETDNLAKAWENGAKYQAMAVMQQAKANEKEILIENSFKEKIYSNIKSVLFMGGLGYVIYKIIKKGGKK